MVTAASPLLEPSQAALASQRFQLESDIDLPRGKTLKVFAFG